MIFLSELDTTVAKDPESVESNVIKKAEEVKTSVKKTPGSLKDRIKSALCKNAQTPNRSPAVENALRKQEQLKQVFSIEVFYLFERVPFINKTIKYQVLVL